MDTLTRIEQLLRESVRVLDKGFVALQDLMPHPLTRITPEQAIVSAARTSYQSESKGAEQDVKLLHYLWDNKHSSVFEQVVFRFRMKLPLMVVAQIVRHRTARQNHQSYRYSEVKDSEFYLPFMWRLQDTKNKQGSTGMLLDALTSQELTRRLREHQDNSYKLYQLALDAGVAREEARLFLPSYGLYTNIVWQMDFGNLLKFLEQRCDAHAQWETRQYANAILNKFVLPCFPNLASRIKERIPSAEVE